MIETSGGWDWLDAAKDQGEGTANATSTGADIAQEFARCFQSSAGYLVLNHLRSITVERGLGPNVSEALLRHAEGQRQLVLYINALIRKGNGGV